MAMLSIEDEAEAPALASPTSSSGASSDNTAFKMSLTASEASRLEEAELFSMDEDGGVGTGGGRTPPA